MYCVLALCICRLGFHPCGSDTIKLLPELSQIKHTYTQTLKHQTINIFHTTCEQVTNTATLLGSGGAHEIGSGGRAGDKEWGLGRSREDQQSEGDRLV